MHLFAAARSSGTIRRGQQAGSAGCRLGYQTLGLPEWWEGLSPESSLGPGGKHNRACVTDAVSSIRWFKQHASELGVDPERVIGGGGSADGHLAMLATLNRGLDDPADPKGFNTSVPGYLLFNPAFTSKGRDPDDDVDVFAHLISWIAPSLFLLGETDAGKPPQMSWC